MYRCVYLSIDLSIYMYLYQCIDLLIYISISTHLYLHICIYIYRYIGGVGLCQSRACMRWESAQASGEHEGYRIPGGPGRSLQCMGGGGGGG